MHGRVNSLLTLIHVDGMSVAKNSTKLGQDLLNIIFHVSIYTYNPPNNLLGLSWDKADHVIQHRTMVIRSYNPPINFHVILLATLRHVA